MDWIDYLALLRSWPSRRLDLDAVSEIANLALAGVLCVVFHISGKLAYYHDHTSQSIQHLLHIDHNGRLLDLIKTGMY